MSRESISCTVFGSFHKFKPEIDATILAFQRMGVEVLAPTAGQLLAIPIGRVNLQPTSFRPLRDEKWMTPKEVEDNFLVNLARADLVYLVDPNGYVGPTGAFELGYCMAINKPTYASHHLAGLEGFEPGWEVRSDFPIVLTAEMALRDFIAKGPEIRKFRQLIK